MAAEEQGSELVASEFLVLEPGVSGTGPDGSPANLEQIQDLLTSAVASEPSLRLLPGFKMGPVGVPGFNRIYFSISCSCGTAGLLSVEVAQTKTLSQVEDALPSLKQHLLNRAKQFASMSCDTHAQMRSGGIRASGLSSPDQSSQVLEKG